MFPLALVYERLFMKSSSYRFANRGQLRPALPKQHPKSGSKSRSIPRDVRTYSHVKGWVDLRPHYTSNTDQHLITEDVTQELTSNSIACI
jgi:hypothetical protein